MPICSRFIAVVFIAASIAAFPAAAQPQPETLNEPFGWLSVGIGPSSLGEVNPTLSLAFGRGAHAFGARFTRASSTSTPFDPPQQDGDVDVLTDASVMYGRRVRRGPVVLIGWGGVGVSRVETWEAVEFGRVAPKTVHQIALPLQVDVLLPVVGPLALGARGTATVGPTASAGGVFGVIGIGRF